MSGHPIPHPVAQLNFPSSFNWIILESAISVSLLSPNRHIRTAAWLWHSCQISLQRWLYFSDALCAVWIGAYGVKHLEGVAFVQERSVSFCFILFCRHHWRRSLAPPEHERGNKPKRGGQKKTLNTYIWMYREKILYGDWDFSQVLFHGDFKALTHPGCKTMIFF